MAPQPQWSSRNTGTGSIHSWCADHHLIVNECDGEWQWLVFLPTQEYRDNAAAYGTCASIEEGKTKATEALHGLLGA